MPQKNKPRNSKKEPRNRHSRPQQQQQRPRQYPTHYCHIIRPDHEDTYRTRITAGGDRLIQPRTVIAGGVLDSGASASIFDPRTVIEPRTVPQADHEDPADRFTRIGPAGNDFYWNHPGFRPPHP